MRASFLPISLPRELDPVAGNINDGLQVPTSFEFLTEENYNPFPDYFRAQFFNGQVFTREQIDFEKDTIHKSGAYR